MFLIYRKSPLYSLSFFYLSVLDEQVLPAIFWSEGLLETFRQNYEQDAMTDFQYFCSAKGFLRHYPGEY